MTNYVEYGVVQNSLAYGIAATVSSYDTLYVATTGLIYATGTDGIGIFGYSIATVTIAGQVFGETGIRMNQDVTTGYGGSAVSVLDGGIVSGTTYGVRMDGTDNSAMIAGQVTGGTAIEMFSFDGYGGNTVSVFDGGIVSGDDRGVRMVGTYNFVLNDGTISGGTGIYIIGDFSRITNTGTILSDAVAVWLETTGGTTLLVNQGVISSVNYAIFCSGLAEDKVVNEGTIIGRIDLGDGNDRLVNNGAIVGMVELFYGDDTYDGRLGTIEGDVFGLGGNDRLLGGVGAETLNGGSGSDTLKG